MLEIRLIAEEDNENKVFDTLKERLFADGADRIMLLGFKIKFVLLPISDIVALLAINATLLEFKRNCVFDPLMLTVLALLEERIKFDSTKPSGQFKKTASNKKLRNFLPEYKFTELKKGIYKTVKAKNT